MCRLIRENEIRNKYFWENVGNILVEKIIRTDVLKAMTVIKEMNEKVKELRKTKLEVIKWYIEKLY